MGACLSTESAWLELSAQCVFVPSVLFSLTICQLTFGSGGMRIVQWALCRFRIRWRGQFTHAVNVNNRWFAPALLHRVVTIVQFLDNSVGTGPYGLPFREPPFLLPWVVQKYLFTHSIALWSHGYIVPLFHPLHALACELPYKCRGFLQPFKGLQCKLIGI